EFSKAFLKEFFVRKRSFADRNAFHPVKDCISIRDHRRIAFDESITYFKRYGCTQLIEEHNFHRVKVTAPPPGNIVTPSGIKRIHCPGSVRRNVLQVGMTSF